jgi:quercetin dioxygenase-like cupin family protein
MPVVRAAEAEVHQMHNARFTSYARPGTGSTELCVWRLDIDPESQGQPHRVLREEVFVLLEGEVVLTIDGVASSLGAGDAAIAPAGAVIRVDNPGAGRAGILVTVPVGFWGELPDGTRITPRWVN